MSEFSPLERSGNSEVDIDFGTETGVNIETKISGDAQIPNSRLSVEDSGLLIEFENKASYLLKTSGTKVHYIENVAELGKMVSKLYKEKKWNRHWYIITNLIQAERATLLISKSSNSKIELKANGSLDSISEDDLVSIDVDFSVLKKKDMSTIVIGKQGPYFPLFKVNGVRVWRLFPRPIGSPFENLNKVHSMNAFTISDLEAKDSGFELVFEEYNFSEELLEDEDVFLT